MKFFQRLKKFVRRIFIDYNEIDRLYDMNSKELEDKISEQIQEKANVLEELKTKQNVLENEILNLKHQNENLNENLNEILNKNLKHQNEDILKELREISSKLAYGNSELSNMEKNQQVKEILLVGFYGAPNLGDELMLETLLEYLKSVPNKKITVLLADNPQYDLDKYEDVRFIHYPKNLCDFNVIAEQYDYIIFGGGAIIDDKQFEKENSYQYDLGTILIKLSMRAIAFNKKVICLALSASKEITNTDYIEKLKYIVENSYYFSVRDIYTKKHLTEKLGVACGEKIINISDIVLANKEILTNIENKKVDNTNLNVGIVWISNENNLEKFEKVIRAIEKYTAQLESKQCTINLIPFYEYKNIDTRFYHEIMQKEYKNLKINIEKYPINIKQTIEKFQKNDIIIGMRYHSILIAHALNVLCIPVCYDIHEHYPFKIKHLNEIFEQNEAISYKNIDEDILFNKLIEMNGQVDKQDYSKTTEILLSAQEELQNAINKVFNS